MDWAEHHLIALLGGSLFLAYSLLSLLRPGVIVRWFAAARPEYEYELSARRAQIEAWIRGLGVAMLGFAILILLTTRS